MSGFAGMFAVGGITSVTATGGNYIYDGTGAYTGYRFHVFTSPGTFTVTSNQDGKTFDAIIVGGGGGAGSSSPTGDTCGGGGGGGAVTEVTGLSLTTNTEYAATVGAGGASGPSPNPPILQTNPGSASSWNGYSAAGGIKSQSNRFGGASGNGNAGGNLIQGLAHTGSGNGYGGGGAGGVGIPMRGWGPTSLSPPAYPVYSPYFNTYSYPTPHFTYFGTPNAGNYNGGGGPGITSTIDGIAYGGGGGGGWLRDSSGNMWAIYWNGKYTPETDPTGSGFSGAGGGLANSAGANGKGGGAGGIPGGPPSYNNQWISGGSGTVVIRYPYP
jgi:hypothetical protein